MGPSYLLFLTVIFLCQQRIRAPPPLGLRDLSDETVDQVFPLDHMENTYKSYDEDLLNVDVPKMVEAAPMIPLNYTSLTQKGTNVVFSSNVEDQETIKRSDQEMSVEDFKKKYMEYFASKYIKLDQFEGHEY